MIESLSIWTSAAMSGIGSPLRDYAPGAALRHFIERFSGELAAGLGPKTDRERF
jgi:hypothetical protein